MKVNNSKSKRYPDVEVDLMCILKTIFKSGATLTRLATLVAIALTLFLSECHAQGVIPSPREALEIAPRFNASSIPVRRLIGAGRESVSEEVVGLLDLPRSVDLAPYCPVPGIQRFNDCTAWAVGRGSYSIQVAFSRSRKRPRQPAEIFSPRFIYSQIQQNNDSGALFVAGSGSSTPSVRQLLGSRGCSSEATTPYDSSPGGFLLQPEIRSFIEAENFTPLHHRTIESLYDIKRALSQNVPPVIAIQVDDRFRNWNSSDPYTWTNTTTTGSHKYHAVCIVGYDDARQAIKILNSWGTDWGDGGFAWVAYDQLNTIDADSWCFEAHEFRVLDANPPRYIQMSDRSFLFDVDGSIKENGNVLLGAEEGFANDVVATEYHLYACRPNGRIYSLTTVNTILIDEVSGQPIHELAREEWEDISSAELPHGLGDRRAVMLTASEENLFVLCSDGGLYRRVAGINSDRKWHEIELPNEERVIGLRGRNGEVRIATSSGNAYRLDRPSTQQEPASLPGTLLTNVSLDLAELSSSQEEFTSGEATNIGAALIAGEPSESQNFADDRNVDEDAIRNALARIDPNYDRPTLVVFFQGIQCEHCVSQLEQFALEMAERDINLLGVSGKATGNLDQLLPFTIVDDANAELFRVYGSRSNNETHGVLLLDQMRQVRWSVWNSTPFDDTDSIVNRIDSLR